MAVPDPAPLLHTPVEEHRVAQGVGDRADIRARHPSEVRDLVVVERMVVQGDVITTEKRERGAGGEDANAAVEDNGRLIVLEDRADTLREFSARRNQSAASSLAVSVGLRRLR
ncbi:hypothetical protein [Streptomyces sp. NPDC048473]|uniref:hypothetical protein n=1 Tax=unclassified Streptomyces TaxID=2593676 RepID=UPI0037197E54